MLMPKYMSPKEPLPIFLTSRYLYLSLPTMNSRPDDGGHACIPLFAAGAADMFHCATRLALFKLCVI